MLHPLIANGVSKHYNQDKNGNLIYEIEEKLTIREMLGAMKKDIAKYESRDKPGQEELDVKKTEACYDYLDFLVMLMSLHGLDDTTIVRIAIDMHYPEMQYVHSEAKLPGL